MKKFLAMIMVALAFAFVGCDAKTTTTTAYDYSIDINDLEQEIALQIAELEFEIATLQERLDNLVAVSGINGQTIYYEQSIAQMRSQVEQLYNSNFDPTKAPTYMYDDDGEYVDYNQLALLMKNKYFANMLEYNQASDRYLMIPYALMQFTFKDVNIDFNDIVARVILMVEELSHYEYYSLSSNGIEIVIIYSDGQYSHQLHFMIPTVVLINDMFTLNFESIIGNEFESRFSAPESYDVIDYQTVKTYYDGYVMNNTYADYVLNLQ